MDDRDELRRQVEALRAENARLRVLATDLTRSFEQRWFADMVEHAPAFVAVLRGREHVFEMANAAYRELLDNRSFLGKAVLEAVPEVKGQGFVELLDGVLETGEAHIGENTPLMVLRDGRLEQRYVTFVYQPITDADGTRSGILVVGLDATEGARAQKRLRAQFASAPVPILVWQRIERDGQKDIVLLDYNQAALRAMPDLHRHRDESAAAFFRDDPRIEQELWRCLEDGVTIEHQTTRVVGNERRHFSLSCASSPPDLVLLHLDDRTERARLEERLRQSQKMDAIGRLAGGIAHDFNNLLSVILSYAGLRLEPGAPPEEHEADLMEIQIAAKRAKELTAQLLAFSRQQVLRPRMTDIGAVVVGLRGMLRRLIGENVTLVIEASPNAGCCLVDSGQIEQVIVNLVVNARDAIATGGTIAIDVTRSTIVASSTLAAELGPGEYVVISVQDTGCGMDPVTLARVFEPFFTTKQVDKGTGLGLATVFGIVKQSGGHISVASEPDRGSTFRIYLPRRDGAPDSEEEPSVPSRSLRGSESILFVEDDEQVRTVACTILRRFGYQVLDAANAGEAFLIAEQHVGKINLLLTDVVMPRISGAQLASSLAARHPEMKVLFLSGYTDDEVLRAGVRDSKTSFLQKPFTPQVLLEKVRSVLGRSPKTD